MKRTPESTGALRETESSALSFLAWAEIGSVLRALALSGWSGNGSLTTPPAQLAIAPAAQTCRHAPRWRVDWTPGVGGPGEAGAAGSLHSESSQRFQWFLP